LFNLAKLEVGMSTKGHSASVSMANEVSGRQRHVNIPLAVDNSVISRKNDR
jgi:hypothetical protein